MSTNVYAKFRCTPLRIKKARTILEIFKIFSLLLASQLLQYVILYFKITIRYDTEFALENRGQFSLAHKN